VVDHGPNTPLKIPGLTAGDQELFDSVVADTDLAVQTFFRIRNLAGQIVPFRYNLAQRLHAERSTKFDYVIKARKVGISSRRFARDLWLCATREREHRLLLTHTSDAAVKLLKEKIEPLLNQCLIPLGGVVRTDHVYFPATKSRYYIGTAGAKSFGRGDDVTGYHFSEYCHWEKPGVVDGVEQACTDEADGLIESTANGHNHGKADWDKAKRSENRYRAVFLPWFVHEGYVRDDKDLGIISDEERKMMEALGLSRQQLAWRRWKLTDMRDPALFPQEYPATDAEAFLTSGRLVFDWVSLLRTRTTVSAPQWRGYLVRKHDRIELELDAKGPLRVWKSPEPGHVYAIGSDVAEGLEGGAYSTGEVLDLGTGEQVAEWHGHIAPDLLADVLENMSAWYNQAVIIPESWPGPGATTTSHLEHKRARLWRAPDSLRSGFETNVESKSRMVLEFAAAVRDLRCTLRSPELLEECQAFVYDVKGRMNPSPGNFSDRLMGMGIVWYCTRDLAARVDYYRAQRPDFSTQAVSGAMATVPRWSGRRDGYRSPES
jgi:hypothetical protein